MEPVINPGIILGILEPNPIMKFSLVSFLSSLIMGTAAHVSLSPGLKVTLDTVLMKSLAAASENIEVSSHCRLE